MPLRMLLLWSLRCLASLCCCCCCCAFYVLIKTSLSLALKSFVSYRFVFYAVQRKQQQAKQIYFDCHRQAQLNMPKTSKWLTSLTVCVLLLLLLLLRNYRKEFMQQPQITQIWQLQPLLLLLLTWHKRVAIAQGCISPSSLLLFWKL